jgi:hypothetical protein
MTTQIKQNTSNELKTKIKIGPALGSYANIFTPRAVNEGDEPKYSISLLFDKKAIANPVTPEGKSYLELVKLVEAVALKSFGPAWKSIKGFHLPMRDGDVDKPDQKEYAGKMFVNASSKRPPGVVGKNLVPITSDEDAYSGCLYVAAINVFKFEKKAKKGVALGLNNLLVWAKGERIDGRKDATEDFQEYGDGESGNGGGSDDKENPLD